MACYRPAPGGIVLSVRLTPKSARDTVEGTNILSDGTEVVHVRVRAPPADGAANAALVAVLARAFDVPKSAVEIVAGRSARLKQVRLTGDVAALAAMADRLPRKA